MVEVALRYDLRPRRAIVRLRVPMSLAERAAVSLRLPPPLHALVDDDITTLWLGPDQWLLMSDRIEAHALARHCTAGLGSMLHLAVDSSAALVHAELAGQRARELLAMASGIDWSAGSMPSGRCARTRFARIPAVVHVTGEHRFDVYSDRSHRHYLERWFDSAIRDPLLRER
jgi:sarcosine oxidase, subunit gamma